MFCVVLSVTRPLLPEPRGSSIYTPEPVSGSKETWTRRNGQSTPQRGRLESGKGWDCSRSRATYLSKTHCVKSTLIIERKYSRLHTSSGFDVVHIKSSVSSFSQDSLSPEFVCPNPLRVDLPRVYRSPQEPLKRTPLCSYDRHISSVTTPNSSPESFTCTPLRSNYGLRPSRRIVRYIRLPESLLYICL